MTDMKKPSYQKATVLVVILLLVIPVLGFMATSKPPDPDISPYKYGIVRYSPDNEGRIDGEVSACATASVGIENGPLTGEHNCDDKQIQVIKDLNEKNNFFNAIKFASAHAEESKPNQGSASADTHSHSSTVVHGNTRSLSASFNFIGDFSGSAEVVENCCEYHHWIQCGAAAIGTMGEHVEIRLPFSVLATGNIIINYRIWVGNSLNEPVEVKGEFYVAGYGDFLELYDSGSYGDVQQGIITPGNYVFTATLDVSAYKDVYTDCGRCQECSRNDGGAMNAGFDVNIAILR
jgi:hypothetical protein